MRWRYMIALLLAIPVSIYLAEHIPEAGSGGKSAATDPTLQPRGACREFVTRHLHDPASAEWEPGKSWQIRSIGADHWVIWPELRATNLFGARTKSRFRCEVVRKDDAWALLDLSEE